MIKEIPLRYKLFLGLAVAVLASLGVVYTVATHFLLSDAKGFIATEHATQMEGIKSQLAAYYSEKSTWDGIEDVFVFLERPATEVVWILRKELADS